MLLSSGDSSGKLGQGYLAEKDSNGTKPFFSRFPDPRWLLAGIFELDPFSLSLFLRDGLEEPFFVGGPPIPVKALSEKYEIRLLAWRLVKAVYLFFFHRIEHGYGSARAVRI